MYISALKFFKRLYGQKQREIKHILASFFRTVNSNEPNERKVIESLTDFCNYYDFTKGFIYQTDGFRYFLLKETIGNEGGTMKPRFDMGELKKGACRCYESSG